jgi:hypothetical protein
MFKKRVRLVEIKNWCYKLPGHPSNDVQPTLWKESKNFIHPKEKFKNRNLSKLLWFGHKFEKIWSTLKIIESNHLDQNGPLGPFIVFSINQMCRICLFTHFFWIIGLIGSIQYYGRKNETIHLSDETKKFLGSKSNRGNYHSSHRSHSIIWKKKGNSHSIWCDMKNYFWYKVEVITSWSNFFVFNRFYLQKKGFLKKTEGTMFWTNITFRINISI